MLLHINRSKLIVSGSSFDFSCFHVYVFARGFSDTTVYEEFYVIIYNYEVIPCNFIQYEIIMCYKMNIMNIITRILYNFTKNFNLT